MVDKRQSARIFVGTKGNNLTHQKTKKMQHDIANAFTKAITVKEPQTKTRFYVEIDADNVGITAWYVEEAANVEQEILTSGKKILRTETVKA